ncbi:MAG: Bax inhibitor-1 family protein [Myxococcota bacterium]
MQNYSPQTPQYDGWTVAQANPETRADFIHKTYQHLALAIAGFIAIEALLLQIDPLWQASLQVMTRGWAWLLLLVGFGVVSSVAHRWAMDTVTPGRAYAGLVLYVVLEALLFLPLLAMVTHVIGDPSLIMQAAWMTAIVFFGLTVTVLYTKAELTFLGGMLRVGFFVALGLIAVSLLFGLSLGTWFSAAMILFAGGSIAYETSNMVHHYRPGQHVAAALGLFASVALLFWYVLRLVMQMRD